MRPRKKKNLDKRMDSCSEINITEPEQMKGHWRNGDRPLHVEIGCGKGAFVSGMAEKHPEIDFVAIEMVADVMVMAMEKAMDKGLTNIRFISVNAQKLLEIFEPGEVDRVYINFSDPWPRNKQHKRRLSYPTFLKMYHEIMGGPGEVHQKTDNHDLFMDSLEYYKESGWTLNHLTYDLHNPDENEEGFEPDTVVTEYETRFMNLGQPIYRVEATI